MMMFVTNTISFADLTLSHRRSVAPFTNMV